MIPILIAVLIVLAGVAGCCWWFGEIAAEQDAREADLAAREDRVARLQVEEQWVKVQLARIPVLRGQVKQLGKQNRWLQDEVTRLNASPGVQVRAAHQAEQADVLERIGLAEGQAPHPRTFDEGEVVS